MRGRHTVLLYQVAPRLSAKLLALVAKHFYRLVRLKVPHILFNRDKSM